MQSTTPKTGSTSMDQAFGKTSKVFHEVRDPEPSVPAEEEQDDAEELLSDETAQALLDDIQKHGLNLNTCLHHTAFEEQLPEGESLSDEAVFLGIGVGDYFVDRLPGD